MEKKYENIFYWVGWVGIFRYVIVFFWKSFDLVFVKVHTKEEH